MKDLDMMHYFLSMEVWQSSDGITLGQGNYAVDILKRFGMMDRKAMVTPMASNMNLLSDASLDDWVLDVPDENETRYLLCCEHIKPDLDRFETCSLDCCKAYSKVPEGYS